MMTTTGLSQPISITVLTGFLGAGKTTFLAKLLKHQDMRRTAVIINEFGEVGLDHLFIETMEEDTIVELQNGCVCCTIRGDLRRALTSLAKRMDDGELPLIGQIVLETTGLADPVPIIHTLMTTRDLGLRFKLDGIITIVDATNGRNTLFVHEEAERQAAMADRIIISKRDLASADEVRSLEVRLRELNPGMEIVEADEAVRNLNLVIGLGTYDPGTKGRDVPAWLKFENYAAQDHHHHHDVNRHDSEIQAFSLVHETPIEPMALAYFIQQLTGIAGPNLLRLKGVVNLRGETRPAVIHAVQHVCSPIEWLDDWPDADHRTRIVFITRSISHFEIEARFKFLMELADTASALSGTA